MDLQVRTGGGLHGWMFTCGFSSASSHTPSHLPVIFITIPDPQDIILSPLYSPSSPTLNTSHHHHPFLKHSSVHVHQHLPLTYSPPQHHHHSHHHHHLTITIPPHHHTTPASPVDPINTLSHHHHHHPLPSTPSPPPPFAIHHPDTSDCTLLPFTLPALECGKV